MNFEPIDIDDDDDDKEFDKSDEKYGKLEMVIIGIAIGLLLAWLLI